MHGGAGSAPSVRAAAHQHILVPVGLPFPKLKELCTCRCLPAHPGAECCPVRLHQRPRAPVLKPSLSSPQWLISCEHQAPCAPAVAATPESVAQTNAAVQVVSYPGRKSGWGCCWSKGRHFGSDGNEKQGMSKHRCATGAWFWSGSVSTQYLKEKLKKK